MKKILLAITAMFFVQHAYAAEVGKPAPDFSATGISGTQLKLSNYKGKIVVLEWTNPGCPFVKKFYSTGGMQKLQADAAEKGIVWLSINSSATGREGNLDVTQAREFVANTKAKSTEYILDPAGEIGHLYGAKSTPHMFVVDRKGTLVYAGAIDDKPTPNPEDIAGAKNYVTAALNDLSAGKSVTVPTTQAYGCNVKY